jgi:hypothetical protein
VGLHFLECLSHFDLTLLIFDCNCGVFQGDQLHFLQLAQFL